jgi:hypothetical protein
MEIMKKSLMYMLQITDLKDDTIFKICIEFWEMFSGHVKGKHGASGNQPFNFG